MAGVELLHSAFEQQARATPVRVAVSLGARSLTYAQLDRAARALAAELHAAGVGPGATVAVCAHRSPELVIGLLGILKAGAAFLPLDPEDPPGRRALMLADAKPVLLLADAGARARLGARADTPTAALRGWSEYATGPFADARTEEADLAYVIYTSGSTGRPKGVMGTHGGIVNRLRWMQRRYRLEEGDRVLHKTSLAFDVSVWELFWPLSAGARLVLARSGDQRHPHTLAETIRAEGVSVVHFVPAMLTAFIAAGELERCTGLRAVMCSGEALGGRVRDLFHARSGAVLHNLYGPTEASIDVTHHTCSRSETAANAAIGRPIDNVEVRVLDARQRALQEGAAGEICIAGIALARGYLGRPDLTAAHFVPDPLGTGERLYRTGDRGRVGPDGELEFLGRLDGQMKIRGVRVERAEVEAALAALPGVERCAVTLHGVDPPQLTAYVVGTDALGSERLRAQLACVLPAQAVPSRFVHLDEIPALPSGKLDRAALAGLVAPNDSAVDGRGGEARRSTLAQIWQKVLGVGAVHVSDNFFALGGDSIRSIEVVALARAAGLELTTHDIFAYQTLGELSGRAGAPAAINGTPGIAAEPFALIGDRDLKAMPSGVCDAMPLTSLLAGLVAESFSNPHYRIYTTTLEIDGRYEAQALHDALAIVVARHDFLRSAIEVERFSEPLRLVYRSLNVAVREIDARGLSARARRHSYAAWLTHERRARLEWSRPPLLRVTAHVHDCDRWRLTLSEPFLDGWSATLAMAELLTAYRARLRGEHAMLPAVPGVSGCDAVLRERAALRSTAHRAFWRSYVKDGCQTRLPRLAGKGGEIRRPLRVEVPIPANVARGLAPAARDLGVPLKSVLLAAHMWVLAALTAQYEVVCGLMVNARPEGAGGERAVGLFLNTVPLHLRVERGSWAQLIHAAHVAEARVLPWRSYPYAQIVRDAGGETPLDSVFNFTHFHPYTALSANVTPGTVRLAGVEGTDQTYLPLTAQFRIDPFAHDAVGLALELNPQGFAGAQVEQLVDLHARALCAIAGGVDARHHMLAAIGPGESARRTRWRASNRARPCDGGTPRGRRQRREGAGRPARDVPRLEELFDQRVRASPDALAVFDDRERLTYEQLDARVSELALAIAARLAGVPQRVGVCVSRGPALQMAILAALRVGAAFTPLDPGLPARRLSEMIAVSKPDVVLVDVAGADALADVAPMRGSERLRVDDRALIGECAAVARQRGSCDWPAGRTAQEPAHILFTSGSTGVPKGVVTGHAALVNRLRWMWWAYPFRPGEVVCARASIGFVDGVTEVFNGLLAGVPTYAVAQDLGDADGFARALERARVTRVTLVPALLRALLWRCDADRRTRLAGISHWVLSGELLDGELLAALRRVAPRATVLNLYGSTEVAGDVTARECAAREPGLVAAGVEIDGVTVRVLDQYGRDVPCGTVGEIAVEGEALATGYLDDARATAERFRPSTTAARGRRMLLTGDLGRHGPDGVLEVLGRRDRQVKINGVRVEPAEIEAALLSHPLVRACAVVARSRADRLPQTLLAHVEVADEIDGAALRSYLRSRLPSAMVPAAVRTSEHLPRTASGKVDLHALPEEPDRERREPNVEALTGVECGVAESLAAELGVRMPAGGDDFFELGGDSLGAMRLLAKLRERFGVTLELRDIFDAPTVAEIGARIEAALGAGVTAA